MHSTQIAELVDEIPAVIDSEIKNMTIVKPWTKDSVTKSAHGYFLEKEAVLELISDWIDEYKNIVLKEIK